MRALRSFAVRASLPEPLQVLLDIAMNLRWSWDPRAIDLFHWVEPDVWEQVGHDPVRMLGLVSPERFGQLTEDSAFMSFLASVEEDLANYMTEPRWYQNRKGAVLDTVAYFSPEFGVSESLPLYSGGLGVLAGDHLKAASDLGVPLIGVGLLYRQGYFRQTLNSDGWQQERYPALDPHGMPLVLLTGDDGHPLKIEVDLSGARCVAQLWKAQVGSVPLILMDCDVEENDFEERGVTDRLYGGGSEHRLRQEVVLGIGGVRAVEVCGYNPDVFHSNEGHAGFLGLERIRRLVRDDNLSFAEALECVRATTVFTTHTPVPAGIDVYDAALMERYFDSFAKECEVSFTDLMALGMTSEPTVSSGTVTGQFNMAVMGLRLAGRSNGVSKLHGSVSRSIFTDLWPDVATDEVPIGSITNGVHVPTWLGQEMAEVLERRLPRGWAEAGNARWDRIQEVGDAELWRARERSRERLVYFVRERVGEQLRDRGLSEAETAWTEEIFDPGILTIGFARRFALYKRGALLLSDPDRLKRMLLSGERPIQIVIAGKAHPLDDGGKEMIRRLVHFAADPEVRGRFSFIEDYDMEVARVLCQGTDVWLNNPRRPLEACGTSGMKAAINGVLNCSILDGWWDECYDGRNGWAIGTRDSYQDAEHQDYVEANALYDLLERDIIPRFYDRSEGPAPRRWIDRIKSAVTQLGPYIAADRMLRDYVEALYEPAALQRKEMTSDDFARSKGLAEWKARIKDGWDDVRVLDVEGEVTAAGVGEERTVAATVRVGQVSTDDISVQLAHGPVGANGELVDPVLIRMQDDYCEEGTCTYRGSFITERAGLYGFAVRVVPTHPDLVNELDLGLVAWA
jgi:glycogen phosphorylase